MPGLTADQKKERVIKALETKPGQWMKRAELAAAMGFKGLTSEYLLLLALMGADGSIDVREVETNAPSGKRYEYRTKS